MTIALTTDQQDLARAVAGFTARHAAIATTRAAFDELAAGRLQPSWQALVQQRLHAIHLPESAGGDGAGLVELAVVLEQAAFGLLPGPLLPTVLAGQLIAEHAPGPLAGRLLPDLVSGATAASAVTAAGLHADRDGDGWRVSGQTAPVLGAASARILVLGASTGDGATLWFVLDAEKSLQEGVAITPAAPVDLTRDVARVSLRDVLVSRDQVLAVQEDRVRDLAAALFAAEAAGVARWCQQSGLAYAKVREQFGVAIGSFQAIKHKCARLFARTELITAAAWDAAVAHGQDGEQFALAAASAAVIAAPAAVDLALETVTLLGGVGYTWEHDVHLYWRRAMSLAALLGPQGGWQRRLTGLSATIERRHDVRLDDESEGLRPWVAQTLAEGAPMPPDRQRRLLADRGLAAPHYPRPHGIGAGPAAQVVIAQEFARAGLAQPSTTVGDWAVPTILAHGTDEQREAFVGPTLRGDIIWCQLFSEPGAGSDLASLRTRAVRTAGGWLLDGQKVWTSQARQADWAICLARTDPEAPKHKGISYFLVNMRSPGVEVRPLREANGSYLFNEVFLSDVFVPDDRLVGRPGEGWRLARTTLGNERVTIASGLGRRQEMPSDYLPAPGAASAPDLGQVPDEALAECGALTADALAFAALRQRLLLRQLAGASAGAADADAAAAGQEGSVLKVIDAWNATRLRRAVLGWHGADAAAFGSPAGDAAQRYLSLPPTLLGGGTLEIQLNVISERVLGLPRLNQPLDLERTLPDCGRPAFAEARWKASARPCHDAQMADERFDLVVRGGTVVTPGRQEVADIGVRDGRIAQLGGAMAGEEELDARGLLVLPGGIDAHVHLVTPALVKAFPDEPIWVDDFWSGSLAAFAGGITTVANMTFALDGETMTEAVAREMAEAGPEAAVDWFLHPVLAGLGEGTAAEIAALAADGHASLKVFLSNPDFAAGTPGLAGAIAAAGRAGALTLVHCEDAGMLAHAGQALIESGRGAVRNFPEARPVSAEVEAVEQAIALCRLTGAPIYIVHLSSAAALDRCREARAAGLPVYVETRPLYLHLTRERFAEPDGPKYVGAPPLRDQSDRDALWRALAAGEIDTVCSDHAPWTLADKLDPELNAVTARQGVADLETLMPMLFSEGVATGRITLDRFVELTSANAARRFGLYPRKGAIAVGSDADLALWDPDERRTIDGAQMQSRADYSPYDGWTVRGWPRHVIRRGQTVLSDGVSLAQPGQGRWLRRNAG